jgi:hypothetical protein
VGRALEPIIELGMSGPGEGKLMKPRHERPDARPRGEQLILVVVGSSIAAELSDRPAAHRLRDALARDVQAGQPPGSCSLQPVVCTDLWYLNDPGLHEQPVIAIGEPARNAATAMLCARLPTAMVIEGSFRIHLDPEFVEERPAAAVWGATSTATSAAIDAFVERYLPAFLTAAQLRTPD